MSDNLRTVWEKSVAPFLRSDPVVRAVFDLTRLPDAPLSAEEAMPMLVRELVKRHLDLMGRMEELLEKQALPHRWRTDK